MDNYKRISVRFNLDRMEHQKAWDILSNLSTPEIYRTLIISIESKTYEQGADLYKFNDEQYKLLEELMSPDYYTMFIPQAGS